MINVTLVNLTPDLRTASPSAGQQSLGVVSAQQLVETLERFRAVNPMQNAEAEPQIVIVSPAGKHLVRTDHGKLLLYDARDASIPYRELTAVGISEALIAPQRPAANTPEPEVRLETGARRASPGRRRALAFALIAGGVLLNVYTFVAASRHEKVNGRPPVRFIADAGELNAQRHSATGRYATGNAPGDRLIEIRADGRIRFARVVPTGERFLGEEPYRLGRTEAGAVCLVTPRHDLVEIRNIDTIVYFNDTYRRQP